MFLVKKGILARLRSMIGPKDNQDAVVIREVAMSVIQKEEKIIHQEISDWLKEHVDAKHSDWMRDVIQETDRKILSEDGLSNTLLYTWENQLNAMIVPEANTEKEKYDSLRKRLKRIDPEAIILVRPLKFYPDGPDMDTAKLAVEQITLGFQIETLSFSKQICAELKEEDNPTHAFEHLFELEGPPSGHAANLLGKR